MRTKTAVKNCSNIMSSTGVIFVKMTIFKNRSKNTHPLYQGWRYFWVLAATSDSWGLFAGQLLYITAVKNLCRFNVYNHYPRTYKQYTGSILLNLRGSLHGYNNMTRKIEPIIKTISTDINNYIWITGPGYAWMWMFKIGGLWERWGGRGKRIWLEKIDT